MMKELFQFFFAFFLLNVTCCFLDLGNLIQVSPDTFQNVSEIISSYEYPLENYVVQTSDGYLLSIQRIPYGKKHPERNGKRRVVLLMHGAVGDSNTFVFNGPDQSLAFILADNGYDVWMGNFRGNTYSRRNVKLSPKQVEFWDFSLTEKAIYDLPAIIDFILDKTGQKSLSYVGYSEGNTIAFILLSMITSYNKKFDILAAYAPVVFDTYIRGLLAFIVPLVVLVEPFYKQIGFVEVLPHSRMIEFISVFVCGTPLRFICKIVYHAMFGYDPTQLNATRLPFYTNQYFAGEAIKVFIQFSQILYAKRFQMYDYHDRNLEHYNQSTPPEYDLSKITAPVALFSGANDLIANPPNVDLLRGKLLTVVEDHVLPNPLFNHMDFILAIDAYTQIHKKLLETLQKNYTN